MPLSREDTFDRGLVFWEVVPVRGIDVIAIGGNAIIPTNGSGTIEAQRTLTSTSMRQVADLIASGRKVIITHGNGPIVGNIVERNEAVQDRIPPMPLDVCGADSQGGIGYMIQQSLRNELNAQGIRREVVAVVSQVVVSGEDEAFTHPTKPIGLFYGLEEARLIEKKKGYHMIMDANRGYRRVVPSPRPLEIVEAETISRLLKLGTVVIAVGGGGIPVVRNGGRLVGVEAVIDKDRAAAVLGKMVRAERLVILTSVPEVYVHFGAKDQKALRKVKLSAICKLFAEGEFPPGSMGPKIEAAIDFLESGGKRVIISDAGVLREACSGKAGTHILPD
jgi:carbamate kinase